MSVNEFVTNVQSVDGVKTAYMNEDGQAVVEWEGNPYDASASGQKRIVDVNSMGRKMNLVHVGPRGSNQTKTPDGMPIQYFEPAGK